MILPLASPRRHPRPMAALAVIGCVVALAGCGSSGSPMHGPAHADFLAFSKCMRASGVPDFPDPSSGGGIQLQAGSGLNPSSPAFESARRSCRKLLPGGGPPSRPSPERMAQLFVEAQCMRQHGIAGFPDPTSTPPPNPDGFSVVEDENGMVLAIPRTVDVAARRSRPPQQHAGSTADASG